MYVFRLYEVSGNAFRWEFMHEVEDENDDAEILNKKMRRRLKSLARFITDWNNRTPWRMEEQTVPPPNACTRHTRRRASGT
jgi:hypothetical protein